VAKRRRYTEELGLSNYDANLLTQERATAEFFEVVAQTSENPKSAANWVLGDVSAALNKDGISVSDAALSAIDLAALIGRIDDNTLSSKMAKDVFDALWQGETNVDDIIDRKGLKQVSDSGALEAIVNALINDNAAQVEQYRVADEGKQKKLIGFFVGQAMKASRGQANPQLLNQLLKEKLG
jgi:aspartyl-tRNA(Asn)/glutamyl-tRNA(Gln) amidotransferase subunit B